MKPTSSQDRGQSSFRSFVAKRSTKLSRSGTGSSKSYKSLNSTPSPLLSSKSLSGARPSRKRALLIGVTYMKSKHELKGTIIDVKRIRSLLLDTFKFPRENILVLTEEESEPAFVPTKKSIENSFKWLVDDCQAGDSLVFYFSGHGVRQPDMDSDESDGFDETICPVDFMQAGSITDDAIRSSIVRPLKNGVTLNAIVDACHSGTVLDLPFVYNIREKKWEKSGRSKDEKGTNGGLAISISACEDRQFAADTSSCIGKSSMTGGAMTYILIEIAKKNPEMTYGTLLDSIYNYIQKANKGGCLPGIFKKVLNDIISQRPQLSASEEFDIYDRSFVL
ncbi:unnamed protein product [Dovyalis caffra]|uniref:Peptidase C14 caspase domain-containing protein n=1 Tax=Dovyalis caffra TaxID=77055 RepID=A0AAV1R7M3_9ROSI|nr:unnamed protein product [Dovyalis caffra]